MPKKRFPITSIRFRSVLMVNAVVAGMIVLFAYLAGTVAGHILEEQLVQRTAVDTCRFLSSRDLAVNDTMLRYLEQLFMVHFVAVDPASSRVVASSLPSRLAEEFHVHLQRRGHSKMVVLGGNRFILGSASLDRPGAGSGLSFFAVSDAARFDEVRTRVMRRIMLATLPTILVATLLSLLLAQAITRPIAQLATAMDRIATEQTSSTAVPESLTQINAPLEVVRLADSFDRLMNRLEHAKRLLARSERLATLGRTAAGVAHELRNPLSAVKMHVRILRDEIAAEGSADPAFGVILKEIDRMELYLAELMSVASEGRQTVKDRIEPVSLCEAAESVLILLAGRLSHANVHARTEFAQAGGRVLGDRGKIRQVLINLVINAVEAMPGGGTVMVRIEPREVAGRKTLRCSVADEGGGVRAEDGADIFDPFVSTKPDGAGLGLYLSKWIVESLDGTMGFENTPSGAVFHFDLPASEEDGETHA